jgi:hypothetical protein
MPFQKCGTCGKYCDAQDMCGNAKCDSKLSAAPAAGAESASAARPQKSSAAVAAKSSGKGAGAASSPIEGTGTAVSTGRKAVWRSQDGRWQQTRETEREEGNTPIGSSSMAPDAKEKGESDKKTVAAESASAAANDPVSAKELASSSASADAESEYVMTYSSASAKGRRAGEMYAKQSSSASGKNTSTNATHACDSAPAVDVSDPVCVSLAKAILARFADEGLWVRTFSLKQYKFIICEDDPLPKVKSEGLSSEVSCDQLTFAHETIPQFFFQMKTDDAKRCLALIVDWTQTADRFVDCSSGDIGSNKIFTSKDTIKDASVTRSEMAKLLQTLKEKAARGTIDHNEVRSIKINNNAIVALLWNPVSANYHGSLLYPGTSEWLPAKDMKGTKPLFQNFIDRICDANTLIDLGKGKKAPQTPLSLRVFPIFQYSVADGKMTLTHIDCMRPSSFGDASKSAAAADASQAASAASSSAVTGTADFKY